MSVERECHQRIQAVPRLGLGLSVDVYSPDLFDLAGRLEGLARRPAYLEVFRAGSTALQAVRQCLAGIPLAYHGEGLWITQPDFSAAPFFENELHEVASELTILASPWLNHECATKQMAGYSFGTYLPPLYTPESANLVADNIALVQERLDRSCPTQAAFGPLFILEMAPLTYFMAGTISVTEYFRRVTERTPCGLVLDIGHLWTVYRYTAAHRQSSLEQFVDQFLDEFPMERVIEIHLAGLSLHEAPSQFVSKNCPQEWIDAHAAPIQAVSWRMLEQVLAHPRLKNLRGVALEVDTKSVELILEEFTHALVRVGSAIDCLMQQEMAAPDEIPESSARSFMDRGSLEADYLRYAQIASGRQPLDGPEWRAVAEDPSGLERYVRAYLPHEILHWGGELTDMFPETCRALHGQGISLDEFVPWWFHRSRPATQPYDFFRLKIDRFLEFVTERAPAFLDLAQREAESLRRAYEDANAPNRPLVEPCR